LVGRDTADVIASPFEECHKNGTYGPAVLGEGVFDAGREFLVIVASDEAIGFEAFQAVGKDVWGHAGAVLEDVVIAMEAGHEVAKDEERPAVAEDVEGFRDEAGVVVAPPLGLDGCDATHRTPSGAKVKISD
jgi:hypothetical protein